MSRRIALFLALAVHVAAPAAARAQESARRAAVPALEDGQSRAPRLDVVLPAVTPTSLVGPIISSPGVLAEPELRDLVNNGFAANLHFRVELWARGGLFDDNEGSTEWDVVVRYEPLTRAYRVTRYFGERVEGLGRFEKYTEAAAAAERQFQASIRPLASRKRQYYNVVLDVEVLSINDLDQVEQWLRGSSIRRPGTALRRGMGTLVARLLGGKRRHYVKTTGTFRTQS